MPTSDFWTIPHVLEIIRVLRPERVLDVGVGFGKYGVLLREYLDVWEERFARDDWRLELHGLEGHEGYANPIWDAVYDEVQVRDLQGWLAEESDTRYDLALMADVLEHFDRAAGDRALDGLLDRSRYLIVTTPLDFHEQGAVLGNPLEEHRSLWGAADFADRHCLLRSTHVCLVALLSAEPIPDAIRYRLSGPWKRRWMRLTGFRKDPR